MIFSRKRSEGEGEKDEERQVREAELTPSGEVVEIE
jgi:hypothetical protein